MNITLKIFMEPNGKTPAHGKRGDAGIDVFADMSSLGGVKVVQQFEQIKVPLGFHCAFWVDGHVSNNFWLEIKNRSGVGTKGGLVELASVIDSSYRGVPNYCAAKVTPGTYPINHGDKIAQMLIHPFIDPYKVTLELVDTIEALGPSERGSQGFGASGT